MSDSQDLQIELWKQSSANVHAAQDRLRNTIHVFLVASFGISAFLLGDENLITVHAPLYLAAAADALLLVVLWYLIQLATNDIKHGRAAVEFYEAQLKQFRNNPDTPLNLFPDLIGVQPRMQLQNELNTAWVSFGVVALKAISLLLIALLNAV